MHELDRREWLLTNGLGSFACGTVGDARTRTYHGWLIAALDPPCRRTLLLSHLQASLEVAGVVWHLGTNFWQGGVVAPLGFHLLRSFVVTPAPAWTWSEGNWQLSRKLAMPYGWQLSNSNLDLSHRLLIEYEYSGNEPAILRLRPLIADRDFHHPQSSEQGLKFHQHTGKNCLFLQAFRHQEAGTRWQLSWSAGEYVADGFWYWNYQYPEETKRGLGDREDLYSPGEITVYLSPGNKVILEARVGWFDGEMDLISPNVAGKVEEAVKQEEERLHKLFGNLWLGNRGESGEVKTNSGDVERINKIWQQLLRASDGFIAYRASIDGPTAIAGYPWFNDWGRDTLIALPGLALATGRFDLAKGLLKTFGGYCRQGLIPNTFPDRDGQPFYNSLDATLWWVEMLGLYLQATGDWEFLAQEYAVVRQIYKCFTSGTRYSIQVDAADGLLMWDAPGVALTWMDVVLDGVPVTPRCGKPVEINALWYSLLCWAREWALQLAGNGGELQGKYLHHAERYAQQAEIVKVSLQKFWHPKRGYLYDTIEPDGRRDGRIRPNAVIALSLAHCAFSEERGREVLRVACERLLTPYGLRSLDAADPDYVGVYGGDRSHRDLAYHQGTVWSWLIGPFIRAWCRFYPEKSIPFDAGLLLDHIENEGCLGNVSEIFDGDFPHKSQGAFAQAWSVAEIIRHWWDIQGLK